MKRMFTILLLLVMVGFFANCYATDGDIYNDGYWRTTSTGTQRPITLTTGGQMPPVEVFTTGDTLTAAETGKVCILRDVAGGGDFNFTLPAATAGLNFTITSDRGSYMNIDPNGTDKIEYSTLAAGSPIRSPGATSDSVTLICGTAGYWSVEHMYGTWTDGK